MATAGGEGERTPSKSSGRKRHVRPGSEEEPQNISQVAGRNTPNGVLSELSTHHQGGGNSGSISVTIGKSQLQQLIKQMTFTRSEIRYFTALMLSRKIKESPSISPQDSKLIKNDTSAFPKTLMFSPPHPATIENLPDVLLSSIFIRLFAKQLAQMRSVSKSWNTLLSEPTFIKFHLHHSIHNNNQTLLHFSSNEYTHGFEVLANPLLQLTNFIKLPVNPQPEYRNGIKIIGSVNGLLCSCYGDSVIHIWNPSLSAVLTLPPYSMPPSSTSESYDWLKVYFRFGFDPKTDDYKVVKLTGFADLESSVVLWWMDVEVYSMRKGSWKLITERLPSHITWIDEQEVVCVDGPNNHLHWLGCIREKSYPERIVAFDLGSETFREMPIPHSTLDYRYPPSRSLGVLAGKLCVMSWVGNVGCEVWVMEEYGVAESWVKRHAFSQFVGDTYPFGFTSGNKFLIQDQHYRLVLYDLVRKEGQILRNDCSYDIDMEVGKIVEYVDSLVWVAPGKRERV